MKLTQQRRRTYGRILFLFSQSLFFMTPCIQTINAQPVISGYVKTSFSYMPGEIADKSETSVSNARVKVNGSVTESTDYTILIDAVQDEILLDAFMSRRISDMFSIKAGQFKTPYSTDNLVAAAKIAFINRPYMKSDVSPAFRDKGIELDYTYKVIGATVALMNGSGQNKAETNNNKSAALRLVGTILPQLNISGNYYTGKNNPDGIRDEFINLGANGGNGNWEYAGEYARKNHGALNSSSFFVWTSYDLTTGLTGMPVVTPAVRYEISDPDIDVVNDAKSRITIGLTANFAKKYSDRIMVNYEFRDLESGDADDLICIEYLVSFK